MCVCVCSRRWSARPAGIAAQACLISMNGASDVAAGRAPRMAPSRGRRSRTFCIVSMISLDTSPTALRRSGARWQAYILLSSRTKSGGADCHSLSSKAAKGDTTVPPRRLDGRHNNNISKRADELDPTTAWHGEWRIRGAWAESEPPLTVSKRRALPGSFFPVPTTPHPPRAAVIAQTACPRPHVLEALATAHRLPAAPLPLSFFFLWVVVEATGDDDAAPCHHAHQHMSLGTLCRIAHRNSYS